jgi:tRNA modification GTPase
MRETSDAIEKIGVERTVARAEAADLRVFLVDSKGDDLGVNPRPDDIVVLAKSDTHEKSGVSGRTGDGVAELVDRVSAVLQERSALAGDAIRDRHRVAIGKSLGFIEEARLRLDTGQEFTELAAEELRCAIRALDSLVGRVDVENLLDEIFLRFCIGK